MVLIRLIFLLFTPSALDIQILTTSISNYLILGSISQFLTANQHQVTVTEITSTQTLAKLSKAQVDLAIDLTGSILYEKVIAEYSENNQIVIFDLNPSTFAMSHWRFCIHSHFSYHADSILKVSKELQWLNPALLVQTDSFSMKTSEKLIQNSVFQYTLFVGVDSDSQTFQNIVAKGLKVGGYKQVIILGQGGFVDKLVNSMQSYMMYYYSGVISGSYGIWSYYNEKSVIVVEEGLENAASQEHYEILAVQIFIDLITEELGDGPVNGILLQNYLESITVDHMKYPSFSVVNKVNLSKLVIGKIENGVLILSSNPTFIMGNPDNYPVIIRNSISMNNPPGFPSATGVPYIQTGAMIALQLITQTNSVLKNHIVQPFLASCGSEFFVEPLSKGCWAQSYQALGTFYLTSPIFDVTSGENTIFQELGQKVPMIGGVDTTALLSNRTEYPNFTRIVGSLDSASFFTHIITALGWDEFVVIYTNTTINQNSHLGIINAGFLIKNEEKLRILPVGYNSSMFEEYKAVFEEVDRVKTRTIFVLADSTVMFYIAEAFYDIGFRQGDLIGFFVHPISSSVNNQKNEALKLKFIEIFEYSTIASGLEWVGSFGQMVKGVVQSAIGNITDYTCYSYDAMMLGLNAVDYLLKSGQAYEDPDTLLKSIRMQRFTGCSGIISIEESSNDRKNYNYALFQFLFDNRTDSYSEFHLLSLNKEAVSIFIEVKNFTWPSKFSGIPSSNRLDGLSCPFEDKDVQNNEKSQGLFYLFLLFFLVYTIISAFIIWKKWWKKEIKQIELPTSDKFGDNIVMIIIIIDLMQAISMGPDISPLIFEATVFPDAVSLNLSNIISFKKKFYWVALYVTLMFLLCWSILSVIVICRLGDQYDCQVMKVANKIGVFLIPIMTEALFLPVLSISFFIFDCQEGIGNSLTDSFLAKDCYTSCWESSHLTFVILTFLSLLAYLPLSLFVRPLWQELESEVNIHANPLILMIKAIIQVLIVILNRTVKKSHESLHGISIILLFIMFSLILLKVKPYNYARTNMWKLLSNAAIIWTCILTSIYWYTKVEPYIWTTFIVLGWILIIGLGIVYQRKKYPNLLISEKPLDISALVKFTFSKNVKIETLPIKRMSTVNFVKELNYEVKNDEERMEARRSNVSLNQTGGFFDTHK